MERYKKRTIALCLASVLTVVGAFGANNYDNTLVALKVNVGSGGYVNLTAFTQKPYSAPIKTSKLDENTYALTLNNMNSTATEPDIDDYDNIESIQISTYPYTTEADGYTRIIIKTINEPSLQAHSALFIPDKQYENYVPEAYNNNNEVSEQTPVQETEPQKNENPETPDGQSSSQDIAQAFTPPDYANTKTGSSFELMTVILCVSILLLIIGIIYMFSRDKMSTVVGDQGEIDIDDASKKTQIKTKDLTKTINRLDKTYKKKKITDITYNRKEYSEEPEERTVFAEEKEESESIVVDLDTLYHESQKNSAEPQQENEYNDIDDLADLLNAFSFEEKVPENIEEESFDEEFYNKVINSKTLRFTNSDIQKINKLLQVELSEETISNIRKYLRTPKKKPHTQEQVLEDLLSTYSIKQNITFTTEDVNAIRKLMNVELDSDFVKDFTTNPLRTAAVAKEITEGKEKKPHRTSEIMTLNVKSLLPDLSLELKKQAGKTIKSEVKPTVVYFSEGYEYKKLSVSDELSKITDKKEENEYKPSYQAPIVEDGYEVSTLSTKDALPDLADVKAHPQKYENKKTKTKVDENALLKSIANVTFKPFYEEEEIELNKFDSDEVIKSDTTEPEPAQTKIKEPPVLTITKKDNNAEKLLKLIEAQQTERALKKQAREDNAEFERELKLAMKQDNKPEKVEELGVYNLNGESYKILKTIKCTENSECRIIQTGNKYAVIGSINNKEILFKQYSSLKNGNLQIRQNDKTNKTQFLVKVDMHKFLISITENNMEFLMDLC